MAGLEGGLGFPQCLCPRTFCQDVSAVLLMMPAYISQEIDLPLRRGSFPLYQRFCMWHERIKLVIRPRVRLVADTRHFQVHRLGHRFAETFRGGRDVTDKCAHEPVHHKMSLRIARDEGQSF